MAARKKARKKAGTAAGRGKAPARKAVARSKKAVRAKKAVRRAPAGKKPAALRAAPRKRQALRRPAASTRAPAQTAVTAPEASRAPLAPPGIPIGVVTHFYSHLSVAVVRLDEGTLRVGDTIHIRGHTTDFRQRVDSLQIDHAPVEAVTPGDDFGLKVIDPVREHDIVYKVA